MLICDHEEAWEDFKVLGSESKRFILELKESQLLCDDNKTMIIEYQ